MFLVEWQMVEGGPVLDAEAQYLADAMELAKGAIQDGCFCVTISRAKPEEVSL